MTPNETNLRSSLQLRDLKCKLYLHQLSGKIYYRFFFQNELLFSGSDYRHSACHQPFGLDSILALLDFLTLCPGDTDREYFDKYTEPQLNWCRTMECQDLRTYLYDYEAGSEKQKGNAKKYFTKAFTEYIHPEIFTLYEVVGRCYDCPQQGKIKGTIPLTPQQVEAFISLGNGKSKMEIQNSLRVAIADEFSRIKPRGEMKNVIFNGDQVICHTQKTSLLRHMATIRSHIAKPYQKAA
jgi:hypothetical protein